MSFRVGGRGDFAVLGGGEITSREYVCGGERRGRLDAVKEKNLVTRGNEEDTVSGCVRRGGLRLEEGG
jgi:hypothetical protein